MKSFGEETNEEKAAIRERLAAEGLTGADLFFAVERAFEAAHRDDPTMRERQEYRAFKRSMETPRPPRARLTQTEIEYLIDRLQGVNDPLGIRALAVLQAMRRY